MRGPFLKTVPLGVARFKKLGVVPPPSEYFEDLVGVVSPARFVAIWCEGKRLLWGDGIQEEYGNVRAWNLWKWCLGIDVLKTYCFGLRGQQADHYLVLDRVARNVMAGPAGAATMAILRQQFPAGAVLGGASGATGCTVSGETTFPTDEGCFFGEENPGAAESGWEDIQKLDAGIEQLKKWLHIQATG